MENGNEERIDNEDYGQLDELGTLMYIPPDVIFESFIRLIPGAHVEIYNAKKRRKEKIDHPGGYVFSVRDIGPDPGIKRRYPFLFIAPSLVYLSKTDVKELTYDINVPKHLKSSNWPDVEQIEKW